MIKPLKRKAYLIKSLNQQWSQKCRSISIRRIVHLLNRHVTGYPALHLLSQQWADDKGGQGGSNQWDVRVDDGSVEPVSSGQDGVETWPVNPQQNGANQGEDVWCVSGLLMGLRSCHVSVSGSQAAGKAKVSPEGMDKHGSSNVHHSQECVADVPVKNKQGRLYQGHDQELERVQFPKNTPHRDQHCCSCETTF